MVSFLLMSCQSYKELHAVAASSVDKLALFKEIGYNFNINCQEKCYLRALEQHNFTLEVPSCDCKEELKVDRNFNQFIKVLSNYFKALEQLSENKLVSFELKPVAAPLIESDYISKAAIRPYQDLLEHLGMMIQNKYRSKQLNVAIEKAHPYVSSILESLQELISQNLIPTLKNKKGDIQQVYLQIYKDSLNSNYDRFQIKDNYFNNLALIDTKEKELKKYIKVLEKIEKGHELLYKNRDKLDLQVTKNELLDLYSELENILN